MLAAWRSAFEALRSILQQLQLCLMRALRRRRGRQLESHPLVLLCFTWPTRRRHSRCPRLLATFRVRQLLGQSQVCEGVVLVATPLKAAARRSRTLSRLCIIPPSRKLFEDLTALAPRTTRGRDSFRFPRGGLPPLSGRMSHLNLCSTASRGSRSSFSCRVHFCSLNRRRAPRHQLGLVRGRVRRLSHLYLYRCRPSLPSRQPGMVAVARRGQE